MGDNANSSQHCATVSLVYKLCSHLTKKSDENITSTCKFVMRALSNMPSAKEYDVLVVSERIKKKLIKQGRQKDALTFAELQRKFQSSPVWKNKSSILVLLHDLFGSGKQVDKYAQFTNELARIAASSPELVLYSSDIISSKPRHIRKKIDDENTRDYRIHAFHGNDVQKTMFGEEKSVSSRLADGQSRVAHVTAMFSQKSETEKQQIVTWSSVKRGSEPVRDSLPKTTEQNSIDINILLQHDLVRDILYAVQGITGSSIMWKPEKNGLRLSVDSKLQCPLQSLVSRFAHMGSMYTRVNNFCKAQQTERTLGLIGQSFISALQEELLEYYRLLATLQAQLKDDSEGKVSVTNLPLTLHRLSIWFLDPMLRLKVLSSVVEAVNNKKGGELASVIFSYMQNGDKDVSDPCDRLLRKIIQPFYKMVSNWIFWGELEDPFEEFFVIANMSVLDANMWYGKYSLKMSMIPSFISRDQAKKVLSTGKAINFLREVCQDHTFVKDTKHSKKYHDSKQVESIFNQDSDGDFQILLEKNYQRTSKLVINVLYKEYNLMEHFQAMRDYFLLGQGDFIRHLMDLLDSDLSKPASVLQQHNLTGTLECAIRATNAQFHEPEILQRLDAVLHDWSLNDIGWNVFTFSYHVNGPIETVFTAKCMSLYSRLFDFLWKAKHMEYMLSNMTQGKTTCLKIQARLPVVTSIIYQSHVILSQMVHFVQQIQYYFAFEVMECCWADLQLKIQSARDLDEIISAHEMFLSMLLTRSLLNEESMDIRYQLFAIYDLISQFHTTQNAFWSQIDDVLALDDEIKESAIKNTKGGAWGVDEEQSSKYEAEVERISRTAVPQTKKHLTRLLTSFEDFVQTFLVMLNDHEDTNLGFLSFRLDFNEYFKNRNTQLQTSLTYLHRRKSLRFV